ncbi:MAG: hypothetical protein ABI602_01060 [Candidatus Saccharibacteria bacterium]
MIQSPERVDKRPDYQSEITHILSQPLQPEIIDSYADHTLDQLIDVVEQAEADFVARPTVLAKDRAGMQDAATSYFGLGDVNQLLDTVEAKAVMIKHLDDVISRADHMRSVVVPTDKSTQFIRPGPIEFQPALTVPRLKTTLFILQQVFNIDLDNPEAFSLSDGDVESSMIRQASYYMLDIYGLDRIALICDEVGNASFIFDSEQLAAVGLTSRDIAQLSKTELDAKIIAEPRLGQRLAYSKNFVSDMITALKDPIGAASDERVEHVVTLVSAPPETVLSLSGITRAFSVSNSALKSTLDQFNLTELSSGTYSFASRPVPGYDAWAQNVIWDKLKERGLMLPEAPEGYISVNGLAKRLNIANNAVGRVIDQQAESLGTVSRYRPNDQSGSKKAGAPFIGLSPQQQQIIESQLSRDGSLIPEAPDGYLSSKALSRHWDKAQGTIKKAIEELDLTSGVEGKVRATSSTVFSPEDQQRIYDHLVSRGLFVDAAPDGYLSVYGYAKKLGVSDRLVNEAVLELVDEIGQLEKYFVGPRPRDTLSPSQQTFIEQYLASTGKLALPAPEGVLAFELLSDTIRAKLSVAPISIKAAIRELDKQGLLGERKAYKFGSVTTAGFSVDQQAIIADYLSTRKRSKL